MLTERTVVDPNSPRMISVFTIQRLVLYHRVLLELRQTKVISSEELSKLTGFTAAQIRKDLSYFGDFGTPGRGYDVEELSRNLRDILGIDREWPIALIGVGNLGKALLIHTGLKQQGFNITHLFDSDSGKIGKTCAGLLISDVRDITKELREDNIKMAILTVPPREAQIVANMLVEAGIQAILNFAPALINAPGNVRILNIDMTSELARLSYYLTNGRFTPNNKLESNRPSYTEGNDVY